MSIAVTIVIVNWLLLLIDQIPPPPPPLYDYDELKWSSKFSVPPQLQLHIYIFIRLPVHLYSCDSSTRSALYNIV